MRNAEARPLISILLAVYEPNLPWLREQLASLNAQDYPNLELIALDDCSPTVPLAEVEACLAACVTAFPYSITRAEANGGSNAAFSALVARAAGEYIAFCDQDDVWLPDKLSAMLRALEDEGAVMACCDAAIIDGQGARIADGMHQVRKRVEFQAGDGVAPAFLYKNFASGCATLLRADLAKAALPCIGHIVYDHWFALYAAAHGRVAFVPRALIQHRVHTANQTNAVSDVHSKQDYIRTRVLDYEKRLAEIAPRVDLGAVQRDTEQWAAARSAYATGRRGAWRTIWKHRNLDRKVSYFELLLPLMPNWVFARIIRGVQRGTI